MSQFHYRDFTLGLLVGGGFLLFSQYFYSGIKISAVPEGKHEEDEHTNEDSNRMKKCMSQIKKFGFVTLENVFDENQLQLLSNQFEIFRQKGLSAMKTKSVDYNYVAHFEKETVSVKRSFESNGVGVIEICRGRLDIYSEMPIMKKIINESPIDKLMENICETRDNWNMQVGILTSASSSSHGPWHRDVTNICGEAKADGSYDDRLMVDSNFEPFYFTILIPLVDITNENGPTEFIIGSHKQTFDEIDVNETETILLKTGSALIFDGRIFHRGRENNSSNPRPVIYVVFSRSWYNDE